MAKMTQANLRKELLKIMMIGNCSLEDIQKAIDNLRGESKTIQITDNNSQIKQYPPGVRNIEKIDMRKTTGIIVNERTPTQLDLIQG